MIGSIFEVRNGIIEISQSANAFLEESESLKIVLVVGENSSGKTTLISKLIQEKDLKSKQQQVISMYELNSNNYNQSHSDSKLLIIQLSNISLQAEQNRRAFAFLLSISSILLYNTKGKIQTTNIQPLYSFVSKLRSSIGESQQFSFPTLFWVLRDFDTSECFQLPKDYMEKSLELQSGSQQLNSYKRGIKVLLKDRECFMFNHPDEKSEYSSFQRQLAVLKEKILMRAKPISINGKALSGQTFLIFAQCLNKELLKGSKLVFENVAKQVRDIYNQQLLQESKKEIQMQFASFLNQRQSGQKIKEIKKVLHQKNAYFFKSQLMGAPNQFQYYVINFQDYLQQKMFQLISKNKQLWRKYYENGYMTLSEQYLINVGNLKQLIVRLDIVRKQFVQNYTLFDSKNEVLQILQSQWIKKNIFRTVEEFIAKQRQQSDDKYQEMIKCHLKSVELFEQEKLILEKNVIEQEETIALKNKNIALFQSKVLELQQALQDQSFQLQQKENSNQNLKNRLEKYQQMKNDEINNLENSLHNKSQEIMKLHESIQELQIRLQHKESQYRLYLLKSEKQEINRQKQQESIQDLVKQKDRRLETLQKQNIKMQKISECYSKLKSQFKNKESSIQTKEMELKESKHLKEVEIKRLEARIVQLEAHLEEQDQINTANIASLKRSDKKIKQLVEENAKYKEEIQTYKKINGALTDRIQKLKEQLAIIKSCQKIEGISLFHQNQSNKKLKIFSNFNDQNQKWSPVKFYIIRTIIKEENKIPFTLFEIEVTKQAATWIIHKQYRDFCQLHSNLKSQFDGEQLSKSSFIVSPKELQGNKKQLTSNDRKKHFQIYLNDLGQNYEVNQLQIFQSFFSKKQGNKENTQKENKSNIFKNRS